jgi:predicted nucleotidyltransferase
MTLSAERRRYVESLDRDSHSLVQQLVRIPAVQKIILFGSYVAGRRDLFTDLDLLIGMYSPLNFDRMRNRPFLRHALKTGKMLYERMPTQRRATLAGAGTGRLEMG